MKGGGKMSLEERVYSALVISATANFTSSFNALLNETGFVSAHSVSSISTAKQAVSERAFDFIIINSPLPDDDGIRFAIDICASSYSVVLLLVKSEIHDEVSLKVTRHSVFTLPKPTSKAILTTALGWMASARERLRQFEKKNVSVQEKMQEIRLVNRAKWILITELDMSEPDAHRYIEKQAMDRCITRREIAEEIIKTYS